MPPILLLENMKTSKQTACCYSFVLKKRLLFSDRLKLISTIYLVFSYFVFYKSRNVPGPPLRWKQIAVFVENRMTEEKNRKLVRQRSSLIRANMKPTLPRHLKPVVQSNTERNRLSRIQKMNE